MLGLAEPCSHSSIWATLNTSPPNSTTFRQESHPSNSMGKLTIAAAVAAAAVLSLIQDLHSALIRNSCAMEGLLVVVWGHLHWR
jgi:hypothetical protein